MPSSSNRKRNFLMTLNQKLDQLDLTAMSRQLDQTISDAATKILSFAPALE